MPLTPVHLGPSLGLSLLFHRYLDVVIFLIASLVIDLEPLILFFFGSSVIFYWSHTFLLGGLIGLVTAFLVHLFRRVSVDYWHYFYPALSWQLNQERSWWKIILSGVAGVWSHLLLDMFTLSGLEPFYPFSNLNPLLGVLSLSGVYFLSLIFFFIAVLISLRFMIRLVISRRAASADDSYNVV